MEVHILYERDDDGGWLAEVPELHVVTKGKDRRQARSRALSAAHFALESCESHELYPSAIEIETVSI